MEESRVEESNSVIRQYVMWSMGAGLIPFPLADLFSVGAVQLKMIRQLCKIYEIDFKEKEGKAVITSLTSSTIAKIGARTAVKLIPGIGTIVGGVTMSVLSGASTYAVGQAFRNHFEKGGTILDIDLSKLKKVYNEKFEKGKEEVRRYQEGMEEQEASGDPGSGESGGEKLTDDAIQKLKDLAELRREGLITPEEFEQMKKRILNDT